MWNIFITGTSRGIGYFLAQEFSKNHHIFWLSRTKSHLDITEFLWDIQDTYFLQQIAQEILEIDRLILNAGVGYFDAFLNISPETYREMTLTNLLSPIILTHILLPKIKKGIIGIGSHAGKKSLKYGVWYSASKFGFRGFLLTLKNETRKKIHLVNPKIVKTDFHTHSKIPISPEIPTTSKEEILLTIERILLEKEKRFEIDL